MAWKPASKLVSGEKLITKNGRNLKVLAVSGIKKTNETVYNFEVKDMHSYFVGGQSVWVHNTSILGKGTGGSNEHVTTPASSEAIDRFKAAIGMRSRMALEPALQSDGVPVFLSEDADVAIEGSLIGVPERISPRGDQLIELGSEGPVLDRHPWYSRRPDASGVISPLWRPGMEYEDISFNGVATRDPRSVAVSASTGVANPNAKRGPAAEISAISGAIEVAPNTTLNSAESASIPRAAADDMTARRPLRRDATSLRPSRGSISGGGQGDSMTRVDASRMELAPSVGALHMRGGPVHFVAEPSPAYLTTRDVEVAHAELDSLIGALPSRRELFESRPFPAGIEPKNPAFGKLVQWDKFKTKEGPYAGPDWAALKAIGRSDVRAAQRAGLTPEMAEHWRNFYLAAAREDRGVVNVFSAKARALLMDDIAKRLRSIKSEQSKEVGVIASDMELANSSGSSLSRNTSSRSDGLNTLILDDVVRNTIRSVSFGVHGGKAIDIGDPEHMCGACGFTEASVTERLMQHGLAKSNIYLLQAGDIAESVGGTSGRHAFVVARIRGVEYLIDPSFSQFTGPVESGDGAVDPMHIGAPGHLLRGSADGRALLDALVSKGYAPLTPDIAKLHTWALSGGTVNRGDVYGAYVDPLRSVLHIEDTTGLYLLSDSDVSVRGLDYSQSQIQSYMLDHFEPVNPASSPSLFDFDIGPAGGATRWANSFGHVIPMHGGETPDFGLGYPASHSASFSPLLGGAHGAAFVSPEELNLRQRFHGVLGYVANSRAPIGRMHYRGFNRSEPLPGESIIGVRRTGRPYDVIGGEPVSPRHDADILRHISLWLRNMGIKK